MELGNLFFGNSRGNFEVNRDLVNSKEWVYLTKNLLQVTDYHCIMENNKERTNNLIPDEFGGYTCELDNKKIFKIMPYYWGECTCGCDDKNYEIEKEFRKEFFTEKELEILDSTLPDCGLNCPGDIYDYKNKDLSVDLLARKCTCGNVKKNFRLFKKKEALKEKTNEFYKKLDEMFKTHSEDCLLMQHNFVFYDNAEEFTIDWYKYPFRDSFMNLNKSDDEIKDIFRTCSDALETVIIKNKGCFKNYEEIKENDDFDR